MSQYNFYQRETVKANSNIHQKVKYENPADIKHKILEQYDHFHNLLKNNSNVNRLYQQKRELSDEILQHYKLLQNKNAKWSQSEVALLHQTLNELDNQHKEIDQEYQSHMQKELSWLFSEFPDIYDRLVNNETELDRATLMHVLNAFCQSESGTINKTEAIKSGLDFMKKKHNLPEDFFDYSKISSIL